MPRTALRDKRGAEFNLNKTFYTILLDNPSLSQGKKHSQLGHTISWKAALKGLLSKRCFEWTPRRTGPELVLSDISISYLDDGRECMLMKFADSSKAGWMAGGMWDGIRIQNYLDALEWEEVRRGEAGRGREKEGDRERERQQRSSTFKEC